MTWQKIKKLPEHAKYISSSKGKYMYRERERDFLLWWQVISTSDPYDITIYPSFGTDHPVGADFALAIQMADNEWNYNKVLVTDGIECACGQPGTIEPHACPYSEEIHNDETPICFCCKECEQECANDI